MPMLWFQYPELCEFQLPGRPRRTKEGDLKVRTQRVVEGKQTWRADSRKQLLNVAGRCTLFESSLRVALCSDNPRTRLGYELSFTGYAHISIAMPKSSTVPAAWEASQVGQKGLEGRTPEIRRQNLHRALIM